MSKKQHDGEAEGAPDVRDPNLAPGHDPSGPGLHHPHIRGSPRSRHAGGGGVREHHVQRAPVECALGVHLSAGHVRTPSLCQLRKEAPPGDCDAEDRTAGVRCVRLHPGFLPEQHPPGHAASLGDGHRGGSPPAGLLTQHQQHRGAQDSLVR